jgi:hypothetical protein
LLKEADSKAYEVVESRPLSHPFEVWDIEADHLIAHGVTILTIPESKKINVKLPKEIVVQSYGDKWIPVTERLPDLELVEANANDHNWYACLVAWRFSKDRISVRKAWYDGECFDDGFNGDITDDVTHWMPLPQPPKGE